MAATENSTPKTTIFISHISEEAELAAVFKEEIDARFLGMINTFVSSDTDSLRLGKNWLSEITTNLRNCAAMLILCSPYSVHRPWVNFECGAGWARAIDIAPICHSGLRPVDLPFPMSLLQGIEAADTHKIEGVFRLIAEKLKSRQPMIDAQGLIRKIRNFEQRYTEATQITSHLEAMRSASPEIINVFSQLGPNLTHAIQGVPERLIQVITPHLEGLQRSGHLQWNYGVQGIGFAAPGSPGGCNFGTLTVAISARLAKIIAKIAKLA